MRLLFIVFCHVLLSTSAPAHTENPKYTVRHYTSDNGLPQNSVRAITQDADGFLWLATDQGIVRFDGYTFVTLDKRYFGLSASAFMSFAKDLEGRKGRLYALSYEQAHVRLADGRAVLDKNVLKGRIKGLLKPWKGVYDPSYSMGLPDRWQQRWIPTHCIFQLPGSQGDFFMWQRGGSIDLYLNWKLKKRRNAQLATHSGLFRMGRNLYHDDHAGQIRLLESASVDIGSPQTVRLSPARTWHDLPDLQKPYTVYAEDFSGSAFIYQDKKLYTLSERGPGELVSTFLIEGFDFQKENVTSVWFDRQNRRIYLGTLTSGLYICDIHAFETVALVDNAAEANIFYAQVPFSDSTLLTPSFHVLGKRPDGRSLSYLLPGPPERNAMHRYGLVRDRTGDIWAMKDSILYRFDRTGRTIKSKWTDCGEISHIYEDVTGRIWLGTRFDGLRYIDPREPGMPLHTFTRKIERISFMQSEGRSILWVGTAVGLYKVNLARETIALIPNTSQYYIRSVLVQRAGELWFTTYEHGFFLLQKNKLTRMPLDKNLSLAHAHCIVSDQKGFFWLPTNQGLFRVMRSDLLNFPVHRDSTRLFYYHYSKQDGFRTNEFNGGCQPCAVRLRNGYFSLPSIDGLVFFKPEQIPLDVPSSKIFIDRIEADSKIIPLSGPSISLPGVSDLKVFISSPYLGNRQNQQLYYTVDADDSDKELWHPIESESQSVHLSNLTSGTYMLKIRKHVGFGAHAERLTTLRIVIPQQWYETWPFKVLVVMAAIAAVYFYFKNRLRKADRLNRILESRVSEKTRNLQDTLSALRTSEQELTRQTRLQMHLIASISHDIRSPLRSIEFASSRLPSLIRKGEFLLAENVGTSVNESSGKILRLLENMVVYVKSQVSGGSVSYHDIAARQLVDDVAVIFKEAFAMRQNIFTNEIPESLSVRSNQQLLKIILHNLIDNANKFTWEGHIRVTANEDGGITTFTVSDTGPGLPDAILTWFNDGNTAYLGSPDGELKGIGLVIVRELAELLQLKIRAASIFGAEFSVRFGK